MKYKLSVLFNWIVGVIPTILALGLVSAESAAGKALLAVSTLAGLAYGALRTSAEKDKAAATAAAAASLSLRGHGPTAPSTR